MTVEDAHITIITCSDYSDGLLPAVQLPLSGQIVDDGGKILGSCLVGEQSVIELSCFHAAGIGWFRSCVWSAFGLRDDGIEWIW